MLTERLGLTCLAASSGVVAVFLFTSSSIPDVLRSPMMVALGHTALDEQAQWLLTHRERSIESTDILQMGG